MKNKVFAFLGMNAFGLQFNNEEVFVCDHFLSILIILKLRFRFWDS